MLGSCYAIVCFLEFFALMRHATLSYVLLNFALMRHATLLYVLWNFCTQASCYAIVCSLEFCNKASCYAIVCSLEHASFYAIVGSRGLCTHASCSAIVCSLELFATVLRVLLNFAFMGHSTHPSVTQYVLMWCWRSSLQRPDPQWFMEDLDALL